MIVTSNVDLIGLKKVGKVVALVRNEMMKGAKTGVTTKELDDIAVRIFKDYRATSAPISQYNFPGATCISIDDEAAHGIPSDNRIIKKGDLVNIDVSAELGGYFADTGASFVVSPDGAIKDKLCDCAERALYGAIDQVRVGVRMNEIGRTIFNEAHKNGFTVIKNLSGHGIGRKLHEKPYNIVNFYDRWDRATFRKGLVLAIETFISTGAQHVKQETDGWTLKTPDHSLVAQFEHTIIVMEEEPIILTK